MHFRALSYFILFSAAISFGACNLINPGEDTPAYIEIKSMRVNPNANLGSNSSKIKDVWVYADGKYIGTFELPAKFPVLLAGAHDFQFGPGIFKNGIAATRTKYPFYNFRSSTLTLTPGEVVTLDTISVDYFTNITVNSDDFESSGISLDTLGTSLANIALDSLNAFEGKQCLKLQVSTLDSILECASNNYQPIPVGKEAYVEMNYKSDQKFYLGLISANTSNSVTQVIIQINPSSDWNKIYIDLSTAISNAGGAIGHKLYFLLKLEPGAPQNTVYIDNLKLLHN